MWKLGRELEKEKVACDGPLSAFAELGNYNWKQKTIACYSCLVGNKGDEMGWKELKLRILCLCC